MLFPWGLPQIVTAIRASSEGSKAVTFLLGLWFEWGDKSAVCPSYYSIMLELLETILHKKFSQATLGDFHMQRISRERLHYGTKRVRTL